MTRPRLILLLRCVALLSLCACTDFGLYLLASFAWVPLGLFMPVFASGGPPCTNCVGNTPSQVQLTASGITNGQCTDCNVLNGTFIINPISACQYLITGLGNVCGASFGGRWSYTLGSVAADASNGASSTYRQSFSAGWTCLTDTTPLWLSDSGFPPLCDGSASTVTVTMIP